MASAFWGGFASSLKGRLDQQYTQDLEMQKARALKELEKEFGAEIVDPQLTRTVGNKEVFYNKYGNKVYERDLSPEEVETNKLKMDKGRLEVEGLEFDVEVKGKDASFYDADRQRALDEADSVRAAREAGVAQGWERVRLDRGRLGGDLNKQANAVIQKLYRVQGANGVNSPERMVETFRAALAGAATPEEKAQVIAQWDGTADGLMDTRNQQWRADGSGGSDLQEMQRKILALRAQLEGL